VVMGNLLISLLNGPKETDQPPCKIPPEISPGHECFPRGPKPRAKSTLFARPAPTKLDLSARSA
jgi:hypothetical protein